ncbi:hypothetical protein FCJ57_35050 [Burkholderia diffusa]|nr:hypothetical protein [Burkholderia diffusa]
MFQCVHHACEQAANGSGRHPETATVVHARRVQISVPPASAGVPACVIWGSFVKVTRILDDGYRAVYGEWLQTGEPVPRPVS